MSGAQQPGKALHDVVMGWNGITTRPGRFGSVTYEYMGREVGHVHGNSHADLPLPKPLRNELVAEGRAEPHHFLPQSGWVSVPLDAGIERAAEVFRLNYDLILKKKGAPPDIEPG